MRKSGKYVTYSERTDVISSVQLIANLVEPVLRHPILWKWTILAAHSGLQGAMVCNLSGTDGTGALNEESRAEMLEFLRAGGEGKVPDEWLAPFKTLLKWIQDPKRVVGGTTWHPTTEQKKHLRMLNDFRNDFSHYKPKSWSIEATILPAIVTAALDGIEHLMLGAQCVVIHLTGNQRRALEHSIAKARRGLLAIENRQSKPQHWRSNSCA